MTPSAEQFHLKEYELLIEDIRKLGEQSGQCLTFAISGCGIALAWLFTEQNLSSVAGARFIPFLVSGVFGALAFSYFLRSVEKMRYVGKLESLLGDAQLGFQSTRKNLFPASLLAVYFIAWMSLNCATAFVAFRPPMH